jgi:hypothetical protein
MGVDGSSVGFLSSFNDYYTGRLAMFEHQSQLVWFRYLYLITSKFMVFNELVKVDVGNAAVAPLPLK